MDVQIEGQVFFPTVFPAGGSPYTGAEHAIRLTLRASTPTPVQVVRCTITAPDGTVAAAEHRLFTTLDLDHGTVEFVYPSNFNIGGHSVPDDIAVIDPDVPPVTKGTYKTRWENVDETGAALLYEHDFKTGALPKPTVD
jgi:hypothetical protein